MHLLNWESIKESREVRHDVPSSLALPEEASGGEREREREEKRDGGRAGGAMMVWRAWQGQLYTFGAPGTIFLGGQPGLELTNCNSLHMVCRSPCVG